jgi:hypothetical protein
MARSAVLGIWQFVVGEDWRTAAGVVATLCATALIAAAGLPAWWLSPIAILAVLYRSVRRGLARRPADANGEQRRGHGPAHDL